MAAGVNGTIQIIGIAAERTTGDNVGNASGSASISKSYTITAGTGANQADKLYRGRTTVTASSSTTLDLSGGLTDAFGTAITFSVIKGMVISNAAASDEITLDTTLTNGWQAWLNGTLVIPAGGAMGWWDPSAAGLAVTAATADLLKLTAGSGANVDVDIIIIGED